MSDSEAGEWKVGARVRRIGDEQIMYIVGFLPHPRPGIAAVFCDFIKDGRPHFMTYDSDMLELIK